jgi:hypothetical protein
VPACASDRAKVPADGCWLPQRRGARALGALAAGVAHAAVCSIASADLPPAGWLQVERHAGTEQCPEQTSLGPRVLQLLNEPADGELPRVRIVLSRDGDSLNAHISMTGNRSGQRQLSAPASSCEELAEALVVALALMLDPSLPGMQSEPATEPVSVELDVAERASAHETLPSARRSPDVGQDAAVIDEQGREKNAALSWHVSAGLSGGQALDGVTVGVLLGAELGYDRWYTAAYGFALVREAALGRGTTSLSLIGAQARAGGYWLGDSNSVRWGGGAVFGAASLNAVAEGYAQSSSASRPWLALGVATVVSSSRAQSWGYRMSLAALAPLLHETFTVENVGRAYETPAITVWLDLLVTARVL